MQFYAIMASCLGFWMCCAYAYAYVDLQANIVLFLFKQPLLSVFFKLSFPRRANKPLNKPFVNKQLSVIELRGLNYVYGKQGHGRPHTIRAYGLSPNSPADRQKTTTTTMGNFFTSQTLPLQHALSQQLPIHPGCIGLKVRQETRKPFSAEDTALFLLPKDKKDHIMG